jgi:hypothetical protein
MPTQQFQADQGSSYGYLGDGLIQANDTSAALQAYEAKRDVFRRLTTTVDPKNALWNRELAVAFRGMGSTLMKRGNGQGARGTE